MAGFADSVRANCQKILERIDAKCYSITWQLFTSVVYKTPVLKGELINSWYPLASDTFSSEKTSLYDKSGSGSLSRINSIMGGGVFFGKDGIITMSNSENYVINAEYLGWPSPQWSGRVGPYGMVGTSLLKVAAENR